MRSYEDEDTVLDYLDQYEEIYDQGIKTKDLKYCQYNEFNGKKPKWRSERLKAKKAKHDQIDFDEL